MRKCENRNLLARPETSWSSISRGRLNDLDERLNQKTHRRTRIAYKFRKHGRALDLSATLTGGSVMDRRRAEKVSKALGDATRLSILEAISARKEMTCGDIASLEGITPATVSHHLKVLADAGLIKCQREGPFVNSRATRGTLQQYMRFLARMNRQKRS
jgi:ArsR family transcriptional regulator, arsenate/arsenite/antimonite-responsive transcriptional repressor